MTQTDWITMGDELRVELDRIELEALAWVEQYVSSWLEPELVSKARRRILALHPKDRDPICVQAYYRGARYGRAFYTDALAILRTNGRAQDWPDEPWTEEPQA